MEEEQKTLTSLKAFQSDSQLKAIQSDNSNIINSIGQTFRVQQLSKFNENEQDPLTINHWRKLLSSLQSEQGGFFSFSGFSSNYESLKNQLLQSGEDYTDTLFANLCKDLPSQRARQIYSEGYQIFDESIPIEPLQVQQGQLGDCYLISSISALAQFPDLCKRLFVEQNVNQAGIFGVWLFESGEWKQFIIDDYLIANESGYTLYSKPVGKGIWVQLLEKAYAKAYGGYRRIEVGHSCDSLRDISGSPTEYIDIKKDFGAAFARVVSALKKDYILTASSKENSSDLQSKHSYSIVDARVVKNAKGQPLKLLKIKNPLGQNFKVGAKLDDVLIQNLGEDQRQQDGIMWMPEQEILTNFEVLTVCHTYLNYVSGSYTVQNKTMQMFYIKNLNPDNHCYFSIVQKHEKFFRTGAKDARQFYKTARLILARINSETGDIVETIQGGFGNRQQSFFEVDKLPAGDYLVFSEVDAKDPSQGNWYTFSYYSEYAVSISPAEEFLNLNANPGIIVSKMMENYVSTREPGFFGATAEKLYDNSKGSGRVLRIFSSVFGFAFIAYMNQSDSSFTEKIEVVQHVNLELTDFSRTNQQKLKEINVGPGENRIMFYRILENNACSHSLNFKGTWFFGTGIVKKILVNGSKPVSTMSLQPQRSTQRLPIKQVVGMSQKPSMAAIPIKAVFASAVFAAGVGIKRNASVAAFNTNPIKQAEKPTVFQKPGFRQLVVQAPAPAPTPARQLVQAPRQQVQVMRQQVQMQAPKPVVVKGRVNAMQSIADMYSQF